MNIWQSIFNYELNINISNDDKINYRFIYYDISNHNITIEIKINDNKNYHSVYLDSWFEKLLYFEIINDSILWSYEFTHQTLNDRHIKIYIDININENLIDDFHNKSQALNCLINNQYKQLPKFIKLNSEKSYFPNTIEFNPPEEFKIQLYTYQKKSLRKMIDIENDLVNFSTEYTKELNFKNIQTLNFDPIKNIKSDIKRFLTIKSKGGILADEMGLGKTITILALITSNPSTNTERIGYSKTEKYWKIQSKATLIICPSHIIKQWEEEAKKSNPKLKILIIVTRKDHEKILFRDIVNSDIIITSHQFLMNFKYYPCLYYKNITPSVFNAKNRNHILKEYFTNNIINSNNIDDETFDIILHNNLPLFEFFIFHRIVLDEGHEIFGEMLSNISLANYMSTWLTTINTNYNWYVSGSPFINYKGLINCIKYLNLTLYDPELDLTIDNNSVNCPNSIFNNIITKDYLWNDILSKICIRHRKDDISDEIKLFGYNENIEWVIFTELEKNLYETKKNKLNKSSLQQLCCHPLIVDSCRKVFGDIEVDLSVMQDKLIEHHTNIIKTVTIKISKLDSNNQAYHMLKKSYETSLTDSRYLLFIFDKLNNINLIEESDNNCSICLDGIIDGSVTKCGHIFCSNCIKTCLQFKNTCPMCNKNLKINDVFFIKKKDILQINPLIEKYGSKLGKLIMMVRNIVIDPDSRIIIFSQWDFMLLLIGKTLAENGITNCFVKGNVWSRNNAINKFKNGKTLSEDNNKVIMLSLKNSASGTNLTEASHIFFVEPINACIDEVKAIEGQAIGRACRIGQKKKVEVYRILVKDTIEEEIFNTIYGN